MPRCWHLHKELAAAEASERLETQLVTGRAQLATAPAAGSVADPQASALARLMGTDEATIRTCVALLLAGLIEVGSALGFTLVSVATERNPSPPSGNPPPQSVQRRVPGPANTARRRANAQHPVATHASAGGVQTGLEAGPARNVVAPGACTGHCRSGRARTVNPPSPNPAPASTARRHANKQSTHMDVLQLWVQARVKTDATGRIPAREAHKDFCRWARSVGLEPGTETRFGRDFTARIMELGGAKVKRRDRAYYEGVSLTVPNMAVPAPLRAAA